eukprot:jgi/Picsp_1/1186/NSC_04667-R1_phd transcription factor
MTNEESDGTSLRTEERSVDTESGAQNREVSIEVNSFIEEDLQSEEEDLNDGLENPRVRMSESPRAGDRKPSRIYVTPEGLNATGSMDFYMNREGVQGSSDGEKRTKRTPKQKNHRNDLLEGPQHLSRPARGKKTADITMEQILEHLDKALIGLRPSEPPSCGFAVNDSMADDPELVEYVAVDLSQFSQSDLFKMAKKTEKKENMPAELPRIAGVDKERLAKFTGHDEFYQLAPMKQNPMFSSANPEHLAEEVVECLRKRWNKKAWRLVGKHAVPSLSHRKIDFQKLIDLVKGLGGFDEATKDGKWLHIAKKMGIDSPYMSQYANRLRGIYAEHIYPIEHYIFQSF